MRNKKFIRKVMTIVTLLELMEKEILLASRPLTIKEALDAAKKDGTFDEIGKMGKTPQNTINALLHKDIARGEAARFVQVTSKPATFDVVKK